ncbi:recombinase family protein [Streptomyces sp. BSE6.1]|uniref:recombinase family protein n=1 Tax=Streptomyces sp. BSE6.1 TaxID=2605730 RepID=UPI001F31DA2C|nr:recombinase family protein [Streptomyces sp. BSE6.1]
MTTTTADPSGLADIFLRRSTLMDDKATLDAHEDVLRKAIEAEGKTVRKVWREEVSASKRGVKREEFDAAIAAVLARETGSLWVYKLDRLSRRGMGHVGIVLDDFERIGAALRAQVDGLDSRNPNHRIIFAVAAEQARSEAINIGVRTRIGKEAHRPLGHWPGGPAPYGLKSQRLYPDDSRRRAAQLVRHPEEYPIARKMADRLLDGESALSVAMWLTTEGNLTRRGKRWRATTVAAWARTPGTAGLMHRKERVEDPATGREYWRVTGDVVLGLDGTPVRVGEGVVTPEERLRIISILKSRTREVTPGFTNAGTAGKRRGSRQAQSLLTGIIKCGRCDGPMVRGGKQYRCLRRAESGPEACQGMYIDSADADEAVTHLWQSWVTALDPDDPYDVDVLMKIAREWYGHQDPSRRLRLQEAKAAIEGIAERRDKLDTAYYVTGSFPGEDGERRYQTLKAALDGQLASLRAEIDSLSHDADLTPLLEPEELAEAWDAADLATKRLLLALTVERLRAVPAKYRGDRTPVLERVKPQWITAQPNA